MTDGFPRTLLEKPIAERRRYFENKVVAHPRLREAHQAVMNAIQSPGSALLIFVYGPTGVGKTTLRLRVAQQLITAALPELEKEKGRYPVASVEVVAPALGRFNWKDYYLNMNTDQNQVLVSY